MKTLAGMLFLTFAVSSASAGTTGGGDLAPCRDKTLFVAHMSENFEQYITTEIITQKIKVNVTMDENKGECVMKGDVRLDFMRGRTGSASMQIISPAGSVIWSATSGDKDSVKDLAHNLVKRLKHDFENSR
jgi:hypothetical protein